MLHDKFQNYQPFGSGEDFFQGFYHIKVGGWVGVWGQDMVVM